MIDYIYYSILFFKISMINALIIIFKLFFIAFLVNLVWEVNHSVLYKTCYKTPFSKCMHLISLMSIKDGFYVSLFYGISVLIFKNFYILEKTNQLVFFIILSLAFSFINEYISIKIKRWEYTESMPVLFNVGLTPFIEIATTGIMTFFIVFILL